MTRSTTIRTAASRVRKEWLAFGALLGAALALAAPMARAVVDVPLWGPSDLRVAHGPGASRTDLFVVSYGIDSGLCDQRRLADDRRAGHAPRLVGDTAALRMASLDQDCLASTLEFAGDRRRVAWRNASAGDAYVVTPTRTYDNGRGAYCREYEATTQRADRTVRSQGVACRQPDGAWQTVR